MVRSIQELRALRSGTSFKPYAVGECWDSKRTIDDWLDEANAWSDNPVGAFDFPLRWRLRDLCDSYGFSLRALVDRDVLMWDRPAQAVTFVENHDVVRDTPIINDKLLAYAIILTHEGYPCVFWQDYFNWNLAQPENQNGIDALIKVHEQNAAGPTEVLFVDDYIYVMKRSGTGYQTGLVFVLNNRGSWNGTWIQTQWNNRQLVPMAWHGHDDLNSPEAEWTNESGWVNVWAPGRGYAVYLPK
jgi:alpha-amylase